MVGVVDADQREEFERRESGRLSINEVVCGKLQLSSPHLRNPEWTSPAIGPGVCSLERTVPTTTTEQGFLCSLDPPPVDSVLQRQLKKRKKLSHTRESFAERNSWPYQERRFHLFVVEAAGVGALGRDGVERTGALVLGVLVRVLVEVEVDAEARGPEPPPFP